MRVLYTSTEQERKRNVFLIFSRKNILFNAFIVSDGQKIGASPDMKHPAIHFSDFLSAQSPADTTIFLALKDEFAEEVLPELNKYRFRHILCI